MKFIKEVISGLPSREETEKIGGLFLGILATVIIMVMVVLVLVRTTMIIDAFSCFYGPLQFNEVIAVFALVSVIIVVSVMIFMIANSIKRFRDWKRQGKNQKI